MDCRPQRRAAGTLFAQYNISRFSTALLPSATGFSGCYRKHSACRTPKQTEAANRRGCSPAEIYIAHPLLPAVSFLGGFQTPAGQQKPRAHPSGRHLKPITKAALWLVGRHVSCLGSSGNRSLAVKLGESRGFDYRVILLRRGHIQAFAALALKRQLSLGAEDSQRAIGMVISN